MRIEMQNNDEQRSVKVSMEIDDSSDIFEVFESLCGLLVSYGFHHESVKDGILAKADEYNEEEKIDEK